MNHTGDSSTNLMKTPPGVNSKNERSPESVELEEASTSVTEHMGCGFGRCRPRFLQVFANPIVFMILLNIYCLVEGAIVSGKLIVQLICNRSIYQAICNPEHTFKIAFKKHVSATLILSGQLFYLHTPTNCKHGHCLCTASQAVD